MPPPTTLAAFLLVAVTVLVLPGPSVLFAVTLSLQQGRAAGLYAVAGLETGLLLHVLAASLGVSALVASSPIALSALKLAGAAYLAVLGLSRLRDSAAGHPTSARHTAPVRPSRIFRSGLLVDLLNPKTALFFLALFPQFVDPAHGDVRTQSLVLGGIVVVLAALCDGAYALAAACLVAGRLPNVRLGRLMTLAPGLALIGLAVATAVS